LLRSLHFCFEFGDIGGQCQAASVCDSKVPTGSPLLYVVSIVLDETSIFKFLKTPVDASCAKRFGIVRSVSDRADDAVAMRGTTNKNGEYESVGATERCNLNLSRYYKIVRSKFRRSKFQGDREMIGRSWQMPLVVGGAIVRIRSVFGSLGLEFQGRNVALLAF